MIAEQSLHITVLLTYFLLCSSQFAISQISWNENASLLNSTAGLSTFWTNRPTLLVNSTTDFSRLTPILLRRNASPQFLCGFYCNYNATKCIFGVLLFQNRFDMQNDVINFPQLVWSANRNHPVKTNATLQLRQDGNLVLLVH